MITASLSKKLFGSEKEFNLSIDFNIEKGELVALYGKSGSGKTSILKMLAGLTPPDSGYIKINNDIWLDSKNKIETKPQKRSIGFVFQEYNLFPNMSVEENLLFALEQKTFSPLAHELIEMGEISNLLKRYPATLSGGQCQRVALIRGLIREPKLFLLDEPLSALDAKIRESLQDMILLVHKKMNVSTIMVSHQTSEIFKMADKVICLEEGKIKKSGTPYEIFTEKKISSKVKFPGEILKIEKKEIIYIITIKIGNNITQIVEMNPNENNLRVGDRVLIATKAFNPIIIKLSN